MFATLAWVTMIAFYHEGVENSRFFVFFYDATFYCQIILSTVQSFNVIYGDKLRQQNWEPSKLIKKNVFFSFHLFIFNGHKEANIFNAIYYDSSVWYFLGEPQMTTTKINELQIIKSNAFIKLNCSIAVHATHEHNPNPIWLDAGRERERENEQKERTRRETLHTLQIRFLCLNEFRDICPFVDIFESKRPKLKIVNSKDQNCTKSAKTD